jgi:hypothetical protein
LTGKPGGRSQAVTVPARPSEALKLLARRYPAAAEIGLDESALPLKLLVWLCSEGLKIASGL